MTYSEIFKEIYWENKKGIRIYIAFAIVLSLFAFGAGNVVYATATLGTVETMVALGGQGATFLAPIVKSGLINLDVSSGLAIVSAISVLFDVIPQEMLIKVGIPSGIIESSFGLMEMWIVRILCFVWFIIAKLPRTNRISYSMGLILENIESKCGKWVSAIIVLSEYYVNFPAGLSVQAAPSEMPLMIDTISAVFNALTCFVILISLLIIYLIVRTFFFFISIILIPFCTAIPFLAIAIEILKVIMLISLAIKVLLNPLSFFITYGVILVVSICFFKKAYITVRYFKNIYVKAFFKKIRGYDKDIPLISPKYPPKVRNQIANEQTDILLPVYLMKKIPGYRYAHRHEKWWLVSSNGRKYICKPRFMNNSCHVIELNNFEESVFVEQSLRFYEIFTLKNEQDIGKRYRRMKKKKHFVLSKEYFYQFERIKEITGFIDYKEYCNTVKQEQILIRKERRKKGRGG